MRFSHRAGAAALLAGAAQAFLLPPSISSADKDIINTLPFEDAVLADGRVMEIKCPGCPVPTDVDEKMHFTSTDDYSLKLDLNVSHSDGADQLMLNGMQIYPVDRQLGTLMQALSAPQLAKSHTDNTRIVTAERQLGYSMAIHHPATSDQDHLELISIHIEILQVADKFLDGLPTIDLKILETPSGKLMIGAAEISEPKAVPSNPTVGMHECTTFLCKWKAVIAAKIATLKGCGGKTRPAAATSRPHGHGRPRPHGGQRPHRFHNKHGLRKLLKTVVLHIFVPILVGVVVGITASLVGMLMGHIAIFIWRALFRRGRRGQYTSVPGVDATMDDDEDETKNLVENQGPPPVYEEAINEKASE